MFGIGMPELMIIFVIALLVFGPKELPKIARTVGKAMAELRRASDDLRDGIQREIDNATREEPEIPPAPPYIVPSTAAPEASSAVPDSLAGAEVQGGAPEGEQGDKVAEAQAGQETVTAGLPASDGQASQPVGAELPASPGSPAELPRDRVEPDQLSDAVTQAAPAKEPTKPSPKPETVPHVPVQPAETRNA